MLPITYAVYEKMMNDPAQANACIAQQFADHPELFPQEMGAGYKLHGWTAPSKKMNGKQFRRIRLKQGKRLAFDHPHAYRTSNMLDRHMEPMARWLFNGRYFHGNRLSADLRIRGWALLHNFRPYCPRAKISETFQAPAHKLNGTIYRDNWLENLLVSTSGQGFQHRHRI